MMNKYKYKTLAVALEKDVYEELDNYCEGKTYKSVFVRRLIKNALTKIKSKNINDEKKNNECILKIKLTEDEYSQFKEYVERKKLGSIATLIMFATNQYITKYPLKKN